MKRKEVFRSVMLAMSLFVMQSGQAQVSVAQNWPLNPGIDYVGWDNTTNVPLMIRHDNNQQIQFFTNNIQRMQLLPSDTYSINGFAPQSKSGSLLLARDVANFRLGAPGPYTRLHLADTPNGSQQNGYRSNMQNGVTMTGNNDQMYVGQLYNGLDYTDAAIVWSDNPGEWLADRLTFNFTSGYNSAAPSGSTSFRGLQTMLIQPDASGAEAYVGLGEFDAAGEAPLERLDVLDGRVRVRELPDASGEATSSYKVMVVDDAALPSGERGVVKWVDPSAIAAAGCEWTMNTGANNHLSTAFGTSDPNCPDNGDAVGIGVDLSITPPPGKLAVETDVYDHGVDVSVGTSGLDTRGVNVVSSGGANYNYGLFADATGATTRSRGVYGHSAGATYYGAGGIFRSDDDATYATGVQGHVTGGADEADGVRGTCVSNASVNSGVYGYVDTPSPSGTNKKYFGVYGRSGVEGLEATQFTCGVFGEAPVVLADTSALADRGSWAGYFKGMVRISNRAYVNHGVLVTSDATLKTNVEDITDASTLISALQPKTYEFIPQQHPHMQMPVGRQWGLLAQEVQQIFPELVERVPIPAEVDSTGAVVAEATSHLAMNYNSLIPILVAAVKEQHAVLEAVRSENAELREALQQRMNQLETTLAACCANPDGNRMQAPIQPTEPALEDRGDERKLRIVPNPFNESTTVSYTLERGGRTQLMANSADGRELRVLQEADQTAGEHQFQWNTASLAPGMYYVTLLLDGQPVVKKGVKVAR